MGLKYEPELFTSEALQVQTRQPSFIGDHGSVNDYLAMGRLVDQADGGEQRGLA